MKTNMMEMNVETMEKVNGGGFWDDLGEFWDEIHPVDDLIDAFGECFEDCAHRLKNLGESVVDAFD